MNPRQRRGVLLILMATLLAAAVFVVVISYVRDVSSQVGPVATVYRAAEDLPAYTELEAEHLVADEVPVRWLSASTVTDAENLLGRRVGVALQTGTMITSDVLVPPSALSDTEREIAIEVNAVTGIADRVEPGDYVDIYAVFADVPGLPKQVRVLVREVRVVSVRGTEVRLNEESLSGEQSVVPVTLALEPNDALSVTYAAAFAEEVRLVGLPRTGTYDRTGELDEFDAERLGGRAVPEGE